MALNNYKELYKKRIRQTLIYGFLLFLFIINAITFCQFYLFQPSYLKNLKSPYEELVNYKSPVDELKDFRNPLIGINFYNKEGKVKILVLPNAIINHPHIKKHNLIFPNQVVVIKNPKVSNKHLEFITQYTNNVLKESFLSSKLIDDNNMIVWFDDMEAPLTEFAKITDMAKEKNLKAKVFDMSDYKQLKKLIKPVENITDISIHQQYENLKSFRRDYEKELNDYISNYNNLQPEIHHFHDKAATMIIACDEDKKCEEFWDFSFKKSLYNTLKHNLTLADKKLSNSDKKVFLLTHLEEQKFATEDDLLQNLDNTVGVILQNGFRTGFLMPHDWKEYQSKTEFIKKLKIKAGLSPDYWSDDITIFYFKAVEI